MFATDWYLTRYLMTVHVIATDSGNSRADMRSASRFGGGGGRTNARRIRSFMADLKAKAGD